MNKSSRITGKRQVTIPSQLFRELGLEEGELIVFRREGQQLIVERAINTVNRLTGALNQYRLPPEVSPEDEVELALDLEFGTS